MNVTKLYKKKLFAIVYISNTNNHTLYMQIYGSLATSPEILSNLIVLNKGFV